jgi:aryl-alcohol dehydrogenase-like predicted oxidoreductase
MQHRALGRTGLQVSSIGLGCMMFGWRTSEEEAPRLVASAIDAGINLFDTSTSYGKGNSEKLLGKVLEAHGSRSRVILCTKVHFRSEDPDINALGNSQRNVIAQCEASLRRLRTDYIDVLQIHNPQPSVPIDETLRALDILVRSGKVRYIGSSSFPAWQVVESLWASKEYGLHRFVTEQPAYNLLDRSIEREIIPMAKAYGIGLLAFSPLAEGILTGKYERGKPFPENSRYSRVTKPGIYAERLTDRVHDLLDVLRAMSHEKGITMSQLALGWLLAQGGIASVLAGPIDTTQLADNLGALAVTFTEDELRRIDAAAPPGGEHSSYRVGDRSAPIHRW